LKALVKKIKIDEDFAKKYPNLLTYLTVVFADDRERMKNWIFETMLGEGYNTLEELERALKEYYGEDAVTPQRGIEQYKEFFGDREKEISEMAINKMFKLVSESVQRDKEIGAPLCITNGKIIFR